MNIHKGHEDPRRQLRLQTQGESVHSDGDRLAVLDQDEVDAEGGAERAVEEVNNEKDEKVTWMSLPHRKQLIVLTLARLSEPLVQTSLQAYMFYQLKSFDESLPDSTIAAQAGMMASSFTGAQFLTAMMWGRISDSERGGRKLVLLIGLFGTAISCLGFGFARTFWQALLFRTLGGALNGNIGVMRTMVSEIVQEKKYQSRAFLLFPMCFNIGVIIGPILGGLMADPAGSYPSLFGDVAFFKKYPYAPPNILSAIFLFSATLGIFFGLSETLESLRHKEDLGTKCGRKIKEIFRGRNSSDTDHGAYTALSGDDALPEPDVEMTPVTPTAPKKFAPRYKQKLPFRKIFTYNVVCTLIAHSLMATHLGTFNNLWFVFLSTPVADPKHPYPPSFQRRLPFIFTGGLGMPPRDVGFAMAILGFIGILMQLFIYPHINAKLGTVKSWRIFLYCFPVAYILVPYLAIVPSKTAPPAEKDGILVWVALCTVLFIQVTGRTFALPATTILVNNASPHPSVLGTMHGVAQSLSSACRSIGPALGGAMYGLGLKRGVVGAVFWGLSALALVNCVASNWVKEGNGHEIILEGDEEEEEHIQAGVRRSER
ncbi:related to E.coli tetracycline resistance protein TCR1 [Phialocephala subalpina]|uniref:Related to E.coli tetracycline resistance protein TCR1 n=1 Tax=Phialocephala subalpina TaxID=576137 RepID=A0A1L7XHE1_9HELO|nr:related to E.coli tetracycline resistance protein TCR1 [Phialocephala subalpina]